MKVLHIIEDARFAGPHRRIVNSVIATMNEVESLVIYPFRDCEKFQQILEDRGIVNEKIELSRPSIKAGYFFKYIVSFIFDIVRLSQSIKKYNPDIVQVNGGSWQIKGVLAAWAARKKVVWFLNDTKTPLIIRIVFCVVGNLFCKNYIANSEAVKRYYGKYLIKSKQVNVLQSPVNCKEFFPPTKQIHSVDEKLDKEISVYTICNINPGKGLEDFIYIANELINTRRSIKFYVVGPIYESQAKYFITLKRMAGDHFGKNIFFLGAVDDVKKHLEIADIFLFMSLNEASPNALWEALAMSLPVITTNVGDVTEIINHGQSGYIIEPGAKEAAIDYIESLLLDREKRDSFSKNARLIAEEKLDTTIFIRDYLRYLNMALYPRD